MIPERLGLCSCRCSPFGGYRYQLVETKHKTQRDSHYCLVPLPCHVATHSFRRSRLTPCLGVVVHRLSTQYGSEGCFAKHTGTQYRLCTETKEHYPDDTNLLSPSHHPPILSASIIPLATADRKRLLLLLLVLLVMVLVLQLLATPDEAACARREPTTATPRKAGPAPCRLAVVRIIILSVDWFYWRLC